MCGIAGIFSFNKRTQNAPSIEAIAREMADALQTRGPDDRGVWADAAQGIALAHRRLSIIDLSPEGHQPMVSASGRYIVSFNGEIYNYRELRAQLDYPWRGKSDTEVLLAAVEAWGIEKALPTFNGMFAFALWDRQERVLTLARDRMGEKPVYYGWVGEALVFASELKALKHVPGWSPTINRDALHLLMRYGYIPAPHSIYTQMHKLMPGSFISIKAGQTAAEQKPYWSFEAMVEESLARRIAPTHEQEATDQLEILLKKAVGQRMVSDVPLGAFLSGGIDSSVVVALMQAQSSQKIKTFTIGFNERGFNEAPHAKAVAEHLGTEHTELYVSAAQAEAVIPRLSEIYDEPFADSSQIPTFLVSQLARQQVTVVLSGDGGDELFGGYNRYRRGVAFWHMLSVVPLPLRNIAALLLPVVGGRVGRYAGKINAATRQEFYRKLCSTNDHPERLVLGESKPSFPQSDKYPQLPYAEWMMLQDTLTYFPDDILTKVDRAAMAVSLETRTPFTDPDIMAFAWRLPLEMKIRGGKGKWPLRQVLYRYVPEALIDRPKAGFEMPVGKWLRDPLKNWAADLLSPESLKQQGFLDPAAITTMWKQHQSRQRNLETSLWNVLMFQSWLHTS